MFPPGPPLLPAGTEGEFPGWLGVWPPGVVEDRGGAGGPLPAAAAGGAGAP